MWGGVGSVRGQICLSVGSVGSNLPLAYAWVWGQICLWLMSSFLRIFSRHFLKNLPSLLSSFKRLIALLTLQ